MTTDGLIPSHGGHYAERLVLPVERETLLHRARSMSSVTLNEGEMADLEQLAVGAYAPLEGFLRESDYDSVLDRMRLSDGTVWPLPVNLSLSESEADLWKEGQDLALRSPSGQVEAVLHEPELYPYNPLVEAKLVYGTINASHPGAARTLAQGPYYVGGRVSALNSPKPPPGFADYWLTPAQTRQEFLNRGWRRVVGFHTLGPVHRAHEYLLRCALEMADGLMIHLSVELTPEGEMRASLQARCYEALRNAYFPAERILIVASTARPRHAGLREALLQAILRQNYGCSHFIVGRHPTSAGKFYGPLEAQRIFRRFSAEELRVTALFFDNAFFCRVCQGMATTKTCSHPLSDRVALSGTALMELLSQGKAPPVEFIRPEVAEVLREAGLKSAAPSWAEESLPQKITA
jgi:sulfate adenylyltransferase